LEERQAGTNDTSAKSADDTIDTHARFETSIVRCSVSNAPEKGKILANVGASGLLRGVFWYRRGVSPPRDIATAERLFEVAARVVRPLAAATPENLLAERERLTLALERGDAAMPRWTYAPPADELAQVRPLLEQIAARIAGDTAPAIVARERARELAIEARIAASAGTPTFAEHARARYGSGACAGLAEARAILSRPAPPALEDPSPILTTDPSSASLVSRMRAELGKRRLPFAVRVTPKLSALAATGESYVLVADARPTTRADVERTVVHEIEGHVVPRVRARAERRALFRLGTAQGTCDQEGYALLLEERHGHLDGARLRELALRRVAIDLAERGATYHDAARALVVDHAVPPRDAVRITERAFRGGTGVSPGLVRDRPYLSAWLALREAFASPDGPVLEDLVSRGQVSLRAARLLAGLPSTP